MSLLYAWYKYPESDECVIDTNYCTRDKEGLPVPLCSVAGNENLIQCRQDKIKQQTVQQFMGCYDNPGCFPFTPEPMIPPCPDAVRSNCSFDQDVESLHTYCVELRDGFIGAEDIDNRGLPRYCFLGRPGSPGYDPCRLAYANGGDDLCPKSCLTSRCCPGSFPSKS